MKRCAFILFLILILTLPAAVVADKSVNSHAISEVAGLGKAFLISYELNRELGEGFPLYNLLDEVEAYCFHLIPMGYIIINSKDGSVPEFSIEDSLLNEPKPGYRYYYNGPLDIYLKSGSDYVHGVTGEKIALSISKPAYRKTYKGLEEARLNWIDSRFDPVTDNLPHSLQTWRLSGPYLCPITGVCIALRYYHDYFPGTACPSGKTDLLGLREFLYENRYITRDGAFLYRLVNGHLDNRGQAFAGLNSYFSRGDITTRKVNVVKWTYDRLRTQISDYKRPVLIEIETIIIDGTDGKHIVVAHGYYRGYTIVNDGWGHNGRAISATETAYHYDMMYFS